MKRGDGRREKERREEKRERGGVNCDKCRKKYKNKHHSARDASDRFRRKERERKIKTARKTTDRAKGNERRSQGDNETEARRPSFGRSWSCDRPSSRLVRHLAPGLHSRLRLDTGIPVSESVGELVLGPRIRTKPARRHTPNFLAKLASGRFIMQLLLLFLFPHISVYDKIYSSLLWCSTTCAHCIPTLQSCQVRKASTARPRGRHPPGCALGATSRRHELSLDQPCRLIPLWTASEAELQTTVEKSKKK